MAYRKNSRGAGSRGRGRAFKRRVSARKGRTSRRGRVSAGYGRQQTVRVVLETVAAPQSPVQLASATPARKAMF